MTRTSNKKILESVENLGGLSADVHDIGLSVRCVNSLKNSGIQTLQEFVERFPEMAKIRNLGNGAFREMVDFLTEHGFDAGMKFKLVPKIVERGVRPSSLLSLREEEVEE